MVRSRKQSRRMPARKKFKIARKVREHNRKMKKEAKSKSKTKRLKKDPGIPNLFPFKEQLLKQMEEKKQKSEEEKARLKLQRKKEQNSKRRSLQGLQNDALKRTKEFEKKQELQKTAAEQMDLVGRLSGSTVDQSLKAYYREFRKVVEMSDVVLEVLDARDPLGCRCYQVEQAVMAAGSDKKLILVLNKIDLVPRRIVEAWLKHFRNEFPTVAFKASTQTQKQHLSQKKLDPSSEDTPPTSACLGADVLVKLLGSYCRNADIKTSITVGVVGLPNVGKSSIINSLKRSKSCAVGATPGLTRSLQEVQLDKHIKLLDSPGVVMAYEGADIATLILRNCVKVETLEDPISPVEAILRRCNRLQVLEHYCIPEYGDVQEFLSHLANKTGKLKKGGIPDLEAAAKSVLRDWNTGRIKFYTHPPEEWSLPSHVSSDIVKEWGKAFDIESLIKEEKQQLSGLSSEGEPAMEVESSHPLMEAFQGEELVEEEGEELEEEMESELSDEEEEEEESDEEMEGEHPARQNQEKAMTVILPGKEKRKEVITKKNTRQKAHIDKDGDTDLTDAYNFDDYF